MIYVSAISYFRDTRYDARYIPHEEKYQPVNNGQRDEVASSVVLLLIVQYDSVIRVRFELDLDAEFVIRFQPIHPDVALAVEGGHVVIPLVDLFVAQQSRVIRPASADESRAGQIDACRGHVARRRQASAELLGRRHRHVISWSRSKGESKLLPNRCDAAVWVRIESASDFIKSRGLARLSVNY